MVTRKADGTFDTEIYRKKTDSSIYIDWDAFATRSWKIGTLKGLFRRAFLVCSTEGALEKEIKFLKHVFTKTNGYPSRIVDNTLHEVRSKINNENILDQPAPQNNVQNSEDETTVMPYICLPYKGLEGEGVLRKFKNHLNGKFKNHLNGILPSRVKPRFIYKGTKLGSFFSVKDKVDGKHQTNLIYGYVPQGYTELKQGYVGETNVRFGRRTREHAAWDKNSAIYKNSRDRNIEVAHEDFRVLEPGYPKCHDRRIAEALYIKDYNPILNGQQVSYKLTLFN